MQDVQGRGPQRFDLAIRGGTAITSDPDQPVIEDAFIGVRGDRIAMVGRCGSGHADATRVIDASGHVVIPGLIDIHTHSAMVLLRGMSEDLGFAPAYIPNIPQGPHLSPEDASALGRLGALERLRFGITLINDSYVHADHALPAMAELGLRVHACNRIHDADPALLANRQWHYDPAIGEATLGKAMELADRWHGTFDGRVGVQLSAHATDTCSIELLRLIDQERRQRDLRVNIHLAQSQDEVDQVRERYGITPVELLDSAGLLDDRLIGAHGLFLTQSDIARLGAARMTLAHAAKVALMAGMHAPTSALRRQGVKIAVVSDAMHGDLIEVMRWALAIGRLQERGITDFWQSEHVFQMATCHPADAMGLGEDLGRLMTGRKADLVLIDYRRAHLTPATSVLGNLIHVCQGSDVNHVIVDGRIVIEDGRSTQVDEETVRREAANAARTLWDAAGKADGVRAAPARVN